MGWVVEMSGMFSIVVYFVGAQMNFVVGGRVGLGCGRFSLEVLGWGVICMFFQVFRLRRRKL